ncbi:iron complex outermembrane recepter protein [Zhouia amylolytica]|uniref:Iron complex outermembrane recepter protein n=1 Tax=Zhouia amylolytica TaxID=376730 RepID=A0A1I6PFW4_9FLAO|nr:TonB-dependent receptor [Zhouia amylolytica]SFS39084.1 iron complex outermembrane recepter protein [Zhouia amylolytica]
MFKKLLFILLCVSFAQAQNTEIKGHIINGHESPIAYATIQIQGTNIGIYADENGNFNLSNIPEGNHQIVISAVGYKTVIEPVIIGPNESKSFAFTLEEDMQLEKVEVFGNRFKHPDKIEALTRLPLAPYEQIQSISIISDKLIEQQGNLTISEATKNVPGVYTFATYGNRRESMSSRGFRGIPILKNGVRIHSDFRGVGILTDMQGVDNIQVLKGAASITQGVATDLGSPGGVINIVTKTPKYQFGGSASMRAGSFGLVRPAFDIYGPMNDKKNLAFRLNGSLERADSYRNGISSERFYINPSIQWRISPNTTFTAEMDYLDDSRTPDMGTVNLGENDTNAIYDLPHDQFLGFENDRAVTKNTTFALRLDHQLTDKLQLKGAYYTSDLALNDKAASLGNYISDENSEPIYNQRQRGYSISERNDKNSVLQFDLIGDELETGSIKHSFQVGFDYRTTSYNTFSERSSVIDTIDIFTNTSNRLPDAIPFGSPSEAKASSNSIGVVAQDVITFNSWVKAFLGLRYSTTETIADQETTSSDALNPLVGIVFSPYKHVNVFASYTNSSYPRSGNRLDVNGNPLGNERFDQLEAGIKTNWLDNKLRFNLTFFKINNRDINLPVYDENWVATGFYQKGGNDERKGIEVELTGRILDNLELITGYSYIDAQYKEHTSFVYGSAPLNTPKHTFNAYANYLFKGSLEGLSIGAGAYYTGERPINDWSAGAVTHEGIVPGQKPFNVASYTLVNAQIAYQIDQHWNVRLLANNLFNEIGYNAYRTRYINQTDPRTFGGVLTYRF